MRDKKFWNFCVFMYDFWHNLERKSYRIVADNICSDLKGSEDILEIACGTELLTKVITKKYDNLNYKAIDYASKMIDICKKKNINASFEIADAENLPYHDNSFDVIIIANALHILSNPSKVINEIKRCLKRGGVIYAPNFLTPSTFKERFILGVIRKFGYKVYNEFTLENFMDFLKSNGLKVNKKFTYKCFRTLLFVKCSI